MTEKNSRRTFIKTAGAGTLAAAVSSQASTTDRMEKEAAEVHHAQDPANLNPMEKKHVPEIMVKSLDDRLTQIQVTVNHVMEDAHWIEFIELIDTDDPQKVLACKEMTPAIGKSEATFVVKKEKVGSFLVREYCNLHGLWENAGKVA